MSTWARMRLAVKVAAGTATADEIASAAQGMLAGILAPGTRLVPRRDTRGLLDLYNTSPLLRMVEGKIAERWASLPWFLAAPARGRRSQRNLDRVRQLSRMPLGQRSHLRHAMEEAGDLERIEEHPLLSMLYRPNPLMLGSEFRQLHQTVLDIVGESVWIVDLNGAQVPDRAWPVPPHWMDDLPGPGRPFYSFNAPGLGWVAQVSEEYVRYFRSLNPVNPYDRGSGTGRSLVDELEVHEMGSKTVKTYFTNDMTPKLLIRGPGLDATKREEMELQFMERLRGFWKRHLPMFLNAPQQATVDILEQDFESMNLVKLLDRERDLVLQVFGSSPEIHGILETSNRATSEVADYHFDKGVIVPRAERFREAIQEREVPRYDSRLLFDYVSPLAEDAERELKVMTALPWAFAVDEIRRRGGEPPKEDGSGKVHMVPAGLRPRLDLRHQQETPVEAQAGGAVVE